METGPALWSPFPLCRHRLYVDFGPTWPNESSYIASFHFAFRFSSPLPQSSISSRCQNGDEGKERKIREADRLPKERETSSAIGRRRSKTQKMAKSGSHPKRNGGIASFPAD